jgi:hypothetical protein
MPAKEFDAFTRLDASDVNAYLANKAISNAVINGAFDFWQRGTSLTGSGYLADRFATEASGGTVTTSRQSFTAGAAPLSGYESAFFARVATSGQSGAGDLTIYQQVIEDVRNFAGQTVTLSFFAKAASGTPKIYAEFEQLFGSGGSPSSAVIIAGSQVTVSTSWVRYSVTIAIPSLTGKTVGTDANTSGLRMRLWLSAGTDFNARTGSLGVQNSTFDIWGVQLEAGTVANDFRRNANSLQGELAACQRYYTRWTSDPAYGAVAVGMFNGVGNGGQFYIPLAVEMRVSPTAVDFASPSGLTITDTNAAYNIDGTPTLDANYKARRTVSISLTGGTSTGGAAYRAGLLSIIGAGKYIGFSAEL